MFFNKQSNEQKEQYECFLKTIGSLSNLFSESQTPYLYYRIAEKIFCRAFKAEDLSRSDVASDAKKGTLGIGLKTFLVGNNTTFQKIAEFNKDRPNFSKLTHEGIINKVSKLRNARIEFAKNTHGLENSNYHCVVRDRAKFKIFEEPMDYINIKNIKIINETDNSIKFRDGLAEYSFQISKSTLLKRFNTVSSIFEFDVKIIQDPLLELQKLYSSYNLNYDSKDRIKATIYLNLFGKNKTVSPRSGLNQWNARGRRRDFNEVYIPIPIEIHRDNPNFFPDRTTHFTLTLPDGNFMQSKICQDNGKALMSYSNKELGQWILRKVLNLEEGELLTYEKLQSVGVDSVRIDKIADLEFEINFVKSKSNDNF